MITFKENIKNVEEYNKLYASVGWGKREKNDIKEALNNTLYSVSAYDNDTIIAYGRIIGDKTCFLYIQDVIVDKNYQGKRIGTAIMEKLLKKIDEYKKISPGLRVYLGADYQKEYFYKKFGFITRGEAGLGEGMILKEHSRIWKCKENLLEQELNEIINILNSDGIIIFPTDTVYGIACNALSERAVKRLFEIKKRDYQKPIGLLTDSVEKIEKVAFINEKEKDLIKKYMPGALTIILKKKDIVPNILTANLDTVALRIPNHKIALQVLKKFPYPLAVTSVNESGKKDGIRLEDFIDYFDRKVNGIVDGGPTEIQEPSTIIRVENDSIITIREGSIKIEE